MAEGSVTADEFPTKCIPHVNRGVPAGGEESAIEHAALGTEKEKFECTKLSCQIAGH